MLSVCIGHKNRAFIEHEGTLKPIFRRAFDALCASIQDCKLVAEIVIADWSDDTRLGLGPWCASGMIPVRIIPGEGEFTVGGAKNVAGRSAQYGRIFFMDSDMLTPAAVILRGLEVIEQGKAFFPFYKRLLPDGKTFEPGGVGTGNVFCLREHFKAAGGFKELPGWADDDTIFHHWFWERDLAVRETIEGFYHLWHPHCGDDLKQP